MGAVVGPVEVTRVTVTATAGRLGVSSEAADTAGTAGARAIAPASAAAPRPAHALTLRLTLEGPGTQTVSWAFCAFLILCSSPPVNTDWFLWWELAGTAPVAEPAVPGQGNRGAIARIRCRRGRAAAQA